MEKNITTTKVHNINKKIKKTIIQLKHFQIADDDSGFGVIFLKDKVIDVMADVVLSE